MNLQVDLYRANLQIDRNALDQVLIEQPQHYFTVAEEYANAVSVADRLKDELRTLEGQLNLAYRAEKEAAGEKFTESQILALVQSDESRIAKYSQLVDAQRDVATWMALRDAFTQRSYVLKDLVALFGLGYFASNNIRAGGQAHQDAEIAANRKAISNAKANLPQRPRVQ